MKGRALREIQRHDPVERWAESSRKALTEPAFQRDTGFLRKLVPLMELMGRYFDAEVRGFENLPKTGPMLLVGNHSGGAITPDTSAFIAAWYRERGFDSPLIGLAFDAAFSIPGFKDLMRKIGQVPASRTHAALALRDGAAVLVYPGGAHEVFRPYTDRNQIDLNGRKGFIKTAIQEGVPLVPLVGHGGHETTIVLARGARLAKFFGFDRLRLDVYPLLLQIPWGITTPAFVGIPLPAKVTLQICCPLDWSHLRPEDADDPEVLERCYDEVVAVMQRTLDQLAAENPRPLARRLGALANRGRLFLSGVATALRSERADADHDPGQGSDHDHTDATSDSARERTNHEKLPASPGARDHDQAGDAPRARPTEAHPVCTN